MSDSKLWAILIPGPDDVFACANEWYVDKPLTTWYCDHCGEPINAIDDGYVIWHSRGGHARDFKIIHKVRCDVQDYESSMSLETFLGPNGLAWCLSMLSIGPIMLQRTKAKSDGDSLPERHQFVDFVRRVQMPYYEEARRYFTRPAVRVHHSDGNEVSPYVTTALKRIIELGARDDSLDD